MPQDTSRASVYVRFEMLIPRVSAFTSGYGGAQGHPFSIVRHYAFLSGFFCRCYAPLPLVHNRSSVAPIIQGVWASLVK